MIAIASCTTVAILAAQETVPKLKNSDDYDLQFKMATD
jgi:hypothetical protein